QTTNRTACSPSASRSCTIRAKWPSRSWGSLGQARFHSCSNSRITAGPEAREKIFESKAPAENQLSGRRDRVDRGQVDPVEHVRFDHRISADVRQHDARPDAQPVTE